MLESKDLKGNLITFKGLLKLVIFYVSWGVILMKAFPDLKLKWL